MLRRRVIIAASAGIVAFWLVMMGLLVYREAFVPRIGPGDFAAAAFPDMPADNWMRISMGGDRVGYVNVRSYPAVQDGDAGTGVSLSAYLNMHLFQSATEMTLRGSAWISKATGLKEFSFEMKSGGQTMALTGEVAGGMMTAALNTGRGSVPVQWPVGEDVVLWNSMGMTALSLPVMDVGQEFVVSTFDPLTMGAGEARIRCERETEIDIDGEPVPVREMTVDLNGSTSRAWINEDGEVQRIETGFGFTLQRTRPEVLVAEAKEAPVPTPNQMMAIAPTGKSPKEGARRMVVRIPGHAMEDAFPSDDTQTADGGTITIAVPGETAFTGASINPKAFADYLQASPFVQADHEVIRSQAESIVVGAANPWEQAMALYNWVYDEIDKVPTLSVPSALEVLETREGDCNEHTVLFTALARSVGIPTRIAIGLMWSEDERRFYYHAWPEVFMGQWIWMDPTYGQPIADATHIKLLSGDIEAWPRLVAFLGGLKIEVVEVE